ncbi:hypothetical protein NIGALANA_298 [Bacillus phage Nigalana]|uniref:Uncharacterized protein n=4 Tax=Wphvirus megatron TaxID=1987728 RepID=A0A024B350_9CAUD|nr:hypothetical protein FP75_gp288 [Bacillus phage Megatron]YP_009212235.1 hypothetical protein QLX47_gp295 [Bacillus phage Eyuki]YP_009280665.1 hypothetical protein BI039_gp084 [Bacillus phage Belinda]YP_009282690.1 hypothetical protein BI005_gp298 [Bacillus phage Nigalana]YP_009285240.1 hypothetical protein BIZ88_gp298 [Bacillus phage DirtyBetty]YP_009287173.1 hypothetical protein BI006_gp297 [Bacillus phage Nemo]ANI24907.1 hypothetical protein SMUDGE_288 [Bacillus phage Smudge]AOZ62544.1 
MITVTLINIIGGTKEKRDFPNEEALDKYLKRKPFIIAKKER